MTKFVCFQLQKYQIKHFLFKNSIKLVFRCDKNEQIDIYLSYYISMFDKVSYMHFMWIHFPGFH